MSRALPSPLTPVPTLRPVATRPSRTQRFYTRTRALQQDPAQPHVSSSDASGAPTVILEPASRKRSLRPYIYSFSFLLLGLGLGQFIRAVVLPPPLPVPDTPEDEILRAALHKEVDRLPIVVELRTQRETWLEYAAYMDQPETKKLAHMTAGAMSGSRGLAVQRVFWNQSEHRLINVVFLGGALTGWPGVTHGGAVATTGEPGARREWAGGVAGRAAGTTSIERRIDRIQETNPCAQDLPDPGGDGTGREWGACEGSSDARGCAHGTCDGGGYRQVHGWGDGEGKGGGAGAVGKCGDGAVVE